MILNHYIQTRQQYIANFAHGAQLTMNTYGRWAKFDWNLGSYACHFLLRAIKLCYMKIRRHPQNRKYTTYRNAVRGGPRHGHRQHALNGEVRTRGFWVMLRTNRQTDRETDKQTYSSQNSVYPSRRRQSDTAGHRCLATRINEMQNNS